MQASADKPKTIAEYIAQFDADMQQRLNALADTIRKAAPNAEERIAYQMPAFYLNGPLVYFAVHKKHIGFYPLPDGIAQFSEQLAPYKQSKGAVQFPLNDALPLALIGAMVAAGVAQNLARAKATGR